MTFRRLTPLLLVAAALPPGGCAASTGDRGAPAPAAAPAAGASLTVRFEGIETPRGQIMLAMFDSAEAHDKDGAPVRVAAVPVAGSAAVIEIADLAPGDYGIKVFHDLDGDSQMDTNPFGMPLEPFAFSNDAKAQGGPALWAATRFPVVAGANAIRITIK